MSGPSCRAALLAFLGALVIFGFNRQQAKIEEQRYKIEEQQAKIDAYESVDWKEYWRQECGCFTVEEVIAAMTWDIGEDDG